MIRTPVADSQEFLNKCEGFSWFTRSLVITWAQTGPGSANVSRGGFVELANALVPGWKPIAVKEYFEAMEEEASQPD